ncbi:MAG: AI-2E family transporter [Hasllibacter sp.]
MAETEIATVSLAPEAKSHRPAPRWAVVGIFVLLAVAGLAYGKTFLTPVILAFVLALVFSPVRRTLERLRIPTGLAAFLILIAIVGTLGSAIAALSGPVGQWTADAPEIGARLEDRIHKLRESFGGEEEGASLSEVVEQVTEAATPTPDDPETVEVVVQEEGWLSSVAQTAPAIAVQLILTLVLLFFVLASGDMFYEKLVHVIPRFSDKRRAVRIAREIERKLSQYLLTISVINAGLGAAIGTALWWLGMPDPVLFGVMAALLNFVPYLGAIIGAGLTLVVGLLTFDGLWPAVAPAVAYYALTSIEGQFVTPYSVGRNLKLNTVVVFIAVAFWAWLWSIVGMLLAVPLLVAVRVLCEHIEPLEPLGDFLSARGAERDEDAPPAPERAVAAE